MSSSSVFQDARSSTCLTPAQKRASEAPGALLKSTLQQAAEYLSARQGVSASTVAGALTPVMKSY
eukprot:4067509-Karenia_brevis.AAC.1